MSKYKVVTANKFVVGDKETRSDEKEITVEAWKFETENGVAMFYDDSGELVGCFIGFNCITKVAD